MASSRSLCRPILFRPDTFLPRTNHSVTNGLFVVRLRMPRLLQPMTSMWVARHLTFLVPSGILACSTVFSWFINATAAMWNAQDPARLAVTRGCGCFRLGRDIARQ